MPPLKPIRRRTPSAAKYGAYAAGHLTDNAAQDAAEALEARKKELRDNQARKPLYAPRRPPRPRSPDRAASIRRRRREIAPSNIPPQIAEHFTPGQLSALSVIARDIAINGQCSMCVDKIAAVAGVCASVVQKAQRLAERLGLLSVEERRRPGRKNLSNIVRIECTEWKAWLRLDRVDGNRRHGIQKKAHTFTPRHDSASWRFDPTVPAPLGSARKWSGEAPPRRPGTLGPIERNDRLEAALARFEASVRARAAG